MATATGLMTVEEFAKLPEPANGTYLELHHGQVVELSFPKRLHRDIQHRLYDLLKPLAGNGYVAQLELPFQALPEYDLRAADVGIVDQERYASIPADSYLIGAPELVIEVESPSNTAAQLDDKEVLCLANGCKEFWIVYPERRLVRVSSGSHVHRYSVGDHIALWFAPTATIAVSDIFSTPIEAVSNAGERT